MTQAPLLHSAQGQHITPPAHSVFSPETQHIDSCLNVSTLSLIGQLRAACVHKRPTGNRADEFCPTERLAQRRRVNRMLSGVLKTPPASPKQSAKYHGHMLTSCDCTRRCVLRSSPGLDTRSCSTRPHCTASIASPRTGRTATCLCPRARHQKEEP